MAFAYRVLAICACLYLVFRVCDCGSFTHTTAQAFCPGTGVINDTEIEDDASSCKVLRDLHSGPVDVYENHPYCFCVVASSRCVFVQIKWNNQTFPHGRDAEAGRSSHKHLLSVSYCLKSTEASLSANGTTVYFKLVSGTNQIAVTSTAVINIVAPPVPPNDISVDTTNCSQGVLTWLASPTAEEYFVTIKCGDGYIAENETVYIARYSYSYDETMGQCQVTIGAVNQAGSSVRNVSIQLGKVTEQDYVLSRVNIFMTNSQAILRFNITAHEECPQAQYQATACASNNKMNTCVPVNLSTSPDNLLHGKLYLPQHKLLNISITILCGGQEVCAILSRTISTHYVQSAGTCGSYGNCSLHCEYAKGRQIDGCVFQFTDHDDSERQLVPVFVRYREKVQFQLDIGTYTMKVYDLVDSEWGGSGPAINRQITVTDKNTVADKTGMYVGIAFGVVIAVLVIAIAAVSITISISYYKKGVGAAGEQLNNQLMQLENSTGNGKA